MRVCLRVRVLVRARYFVTYVDVPVFILRMRCSKLFFVRMRLNALE